MTINPSIFKAYDVRGLYPSEINEEAARLIGRGFVEAIDEEEVGLGLSGELDPAVLMPATESTASSYIAVVMPMRI